MSKNNNLKKALELYQERKFENFPSEDELEKTHTFSDKFEKKMNHLIKSQNNFFYTHIWTKRTPSRVAFIAACFTVLLTLTAFAYVLFSGLAGDELKFSTEYKGNGIVEVLVENQSDKNLKFTETFKLKQWSIEKEILTKKQEMPLIKPGESQTIIIDLSGYDVALLETPLIGTDWYYFVFTNNNFLHGYDWMATVKFAESIKEETPQPEIPNEKKPLEDNTSKADIDYIKANYTIQKPISQFSAAIPYNDYDENGVYVHAELDIKAESGTDIVALASGMVIEVDNDSSIGNYIIIDHGDGLVSKYAHCKEVLKKSGDTVELDDVIATVGSTGKSTGSHLSFSVTLNGVPINSVLLFE